MGKRKSKIIVFEQKKRGFDPEIYEHVKTFYYRDDVSTALPGKRDCKSIRKGTRLQKRVLNDYLSNLHQKMIAGKSDLKLPFATFARMRPVNFVLENFVSRRSCLYTQHQHVALKLKMLKENRVKHIPSHPDIFIKTYRDQEEICKLFETYKTKSYHFEQWKKTPVTVKSRSGEEKVVRKMKIVNQKKKLKQILKKSLLKKLKSL